MLGAGSLLVFAPDPVQAFAESSYTQRQAFHLAANSSLVLLDWLSSGRPARGERWAFSHFASRNDVLIAGERVFLDSLRLDPTDGEFLSPRLAGRFNCLGLLLLLGPLVRDLATQLVQNIAARPVTRLAPLVCSVSPLPNGALLRLAGEQVEAVADELHQYLAGLQDLLGDDPWARKW